MSLALKPKWIRFLAALPMVAGVLFGLGLGWVFFNRSHTEVNTPYRYRLQIPSSGKATANLEREIAFYQERIQRNPNDGLDRAYLARTYLKMSHATGNAQWYLLAEQSAKRSLSSLPFNNQGALTVLARVEVAQHNFVAAIRLAEQVLKEKPQNEDALSILVTSYLALGQIDLADRTADALVVRIPSLGALTLRALVKVAQGQDAQAIQDFEAAIAVEEAGEAGSSAWVRTMLGRFYFKRGNPLLARQLYEEALRILPRYPLALLNLAELETRLGHYQKAEQHYLNVFSSPAYPNIYDHIALEGRARLKELQGDRTGAKELWEQAEVLLRQQIDLNSFGHRRALARLLLVRDRSVDLPEALTLMQTEAQARRDAETLDTLAWVLSRSGRWQEAKQIIQEALQRGTRDAGMFYRAGTIEEALGNLQQRDSYFKQALAVDPTFNEQARKALGVGVELSTSGQN